VFVGRGAERHRIESLLATARAGTSGVLVVQGEAGIGKSALLGHARAQAQAQTRPGGPGGSGPAVAGSGGSGSGGSGSGRSGAGGAGESGRSGRGMTELRMDGVEGEARLAFAGLTELLRPVTAAVADLPSPQADALHSALALHAEPANPLAVRVALLTLLAALAEDAPVLVTVDDAQWVDESSLEALAFAARRLTVERVALLVAERDAAPAPAPASASASASAALAFGPDAVLRLAGLPDDEARQLLAQAGRPGLGAAAVDRLVRMAAGNPLALLELPSGLGLGLGLGSDPDPAVLAGVAPPPVGPRVQQVFRTRLDRLPAPARLAVGVVAADGAAGLGEVLRALATLGLDAGALGPAEDEGLVTIEADRIDLRHPLLRPAAYHALPAPARRQVHAALAAALGRPGEVERRTWHRAAAAVGPDEDVASALDEVARSAERRGDLPTTAHGFARAAGLTADDDTRARRLLASAEAWLAAGHWEQALDQLDQAAVHAVEPGLRADIAASTGQFEVYRAGPERGMALLVAAADAVEADDPARATRMLAYAVNGAVYAADIDRAVVLASRAVACGERAGGLDTVAGTLVRVEAGLLAGDPSVVPLLEPLAQLAEGLFGSDLADAEHVFSLVVLADFVLESWDRADRLLDMMVRRARATGRLFMLAFALVIKGELDFRRGRWSSAYSTVTAEGWAAPQDLPGIGSWLHAVQARVEAGLGLDDDAAAHARSALAAATATGSRSVVAWAGASLGFLELGRGRPQAAVDWLTEVASIMDGGGFGEPGILWWAPDLIEAHWRVGDLGAARRRLEAFQAQADATGRRWALAAAARCAGLLASTPAEAEAAFATALRWHDQLDAPFERARTLLRLAEHRLTVGAGPGGRGAEGPLRAALATFERLGAEPWAAQARRLLGAEPVPVEVAPLTRQERQVAAIVGRGATNREAAEQLFLSPRTIDFHLQNIYRKLQVRSRTELALRIAADDPGASAVPPGVRPTSEQATT
jgi:DNA-binding CsgD family transcriptional regulator